MDNNNEEFGLLDTEEIKTVDSTSTDAEPKQIESGVNARIGDLELADIEPEERFDPEDIKWDQIVRLASGDIIELRSTKTDAPALYIGMRVIYGTKLVQEKAKISKFIETQKTDNSGMDIPVIVLKVGEKIIYVNDPRHILKVEGQQSGHLQDRNIIKWVKANLTIEIPDAIFTAYYREDFQETAKNDSFFISVKDHLMLIRIINEKSLNDSIAKITIEKDSKVIMQGTYQLQNGFKYVSLPEEIDVSDVIRIEFFKKPTP